MPNRKELIKKLELVSLAINHSSFIPEFRNFHFNKSTLAATDGTISIVTTSPLPEESFAVKADSFLSLLQNLNTEEIKLNFKEDSLVVKTKRIEGKFAIQEPKEIKIELDSAIDLSTLPEIQQEQLTGIHLCSFGACKEKTSGAISGVRIEGNKIYSTDRFRVHCFELEQGITVPNLTLPIKFCEILYKVKDDVTQYVFSKDTFSVELSDGTVIGTVIFSEDYPELGQYFEIIDKTKFLELKFKDELKTILDKHLKSFLSNVDSYNKEIKFVVEGTTCVLYSESKNGGNLLEEVEIEEDIGQYEFIANPILLSEVLQYGEGKFLYHPEDNIILLDAGKLQILIQTKV